MQLYNVLNWSGPVGGGINQAVTAEVHAVAKCDNDRSEYLVANETVAGTIGVHLGLPLPPHCLAERDGCAYFLSLNFNLTGERLPPVNPADVAAELPEQAASIIAFGAFIGNFDRHAANISAVLQSKPHRVTVFDHDRCLLGTERANMDARLQAADTSLVIDGSTGGNRHCLIDHVTDGGAITTWVQRIEAIPDWFIKNTVDSTAGYAGLSDREAGALSDFLVGRRRKLHGLFKGAFANGHFSSMTQGGL